MEACAINTSNQGSTATAVTRSQIRGSGLLLSGRLLATLINFAVQVLIVRYLSKTDYGTWALALSVVAFFQVLVPLGLDRAIPRFVPIYHEEKRFDRILGTVLLVIGTTLAVSAVVIACVYVMPDRVAQFIASGDFNTSLLLVMIFLVPLEAVDSIMTGLFASFGSATTIFFRSYILGPGLKLAVVLLLVLSGQTVVFLAVGYLVASVFGLLFYAWLLMKRLRIVSANADGVSVPAREVFSFSFPLLSTDLTSAAHQSLLIVIIGHFSGLTEVAAYKVVLPVAALNTLAMSVFAVLYTPAASRLFARRDHAGIAHLYWQTAAWMAVISFPVFAITLALAQPVVEALFGVRYASSATLLSILSVGYYFNVLSGLNGMTLKVLGRIRYTVATDVIAAVVGVGLAFMLVPPFGAYGGAIAATATLILHNLMKQFGLRDLIGAAPGGRQAVLYGAIAACSLGLVTLHIVDSPAYVVLAVAVVATLAVFASGQRILNVGETFPEALKIPLMGRLFA